MCGMCLYGMGMQCVCVICVVCVWCVCVSVCVCLGKEEEKLLSCEQVWCRHSRCEPAFQPFSDLDLDLTLGHHWQVLRSAPT